MIKLAHKYRMTIFHQERTGITSNDYPTDYTRDNWTLKKANMTKQGFTILCEINIPSRLHGNKGFYKFYAYAAAKLTN